MDLMICMRGEPEQLPYLPEIAALGAGVELGSYGLDGVKSPEHWQNRVARHRAVRGQFSGRVALHGPFIGMAYNHIDHLIRDAVQRRMDMTFEAAAGLRAGRVVLHTYLPREIGLFKLTEPWLQWNTEFWKREITRWADAGIEVVLENETEESPDLAIRLVGEVNSRFLGLCMDIGHHHLFSDIPAAEWVRRMGTRLRHVHLHDNDRSCDRHWPLGRGTIDFEPFLAALLLHAPQQATVSLEVDDKIEVKMVDLRTLAARFPRG